MPTTTPPVKIDAVRSHGGDAVELSCMANPIPALMVTLWNLKKRKLTFVHPFDDPDVIAGQRARLALEILRQHAGPIHAIFVAIGGGGLIAGVSAYVKAVRPDIKIIGVKPLTLTRWHGLESEQTRHHE